MNSNENFSNERKYLRIKGWHIKLPMFRLPCVLVYQTYSMLRHCTFTIRYNLKNIYHEYSSILMKTEEMNEKMRKNQGDVLTKLPISQLLSAL